MQNKDLRNNKGQFTKGRIPWNKGLKTGLVPKTAFQKGESFSPSTQFMRGHLPWNKGKGGVMPVPWNKNKLFVNIRGQRHWNWRGGITPLNVKIRNSISYREWRNYIFRRDGYTCQRCGRIGGQLNADHIKDFSYYPELRFDTSNGQTLCTICHKLKGTYKGKRYAINATR